MCLRNRKVGNLALDDVSLRAKEIRMKDVLLFYTFLQICCPSGTKEVPNPLDHDKRSKQLK